MPPWRTLSHEGAMNTLEFLQRVLPDRGVYQAAIFSPDRKAPGHKAFDSLAAFADFVGSRADSALSIYHACASYKQASVEREVDGKTRRQYRTAENWDHAKSFWVDVDCGEEKHAEGAGYRTKKDAVLALYAFSDKISWPRPMLVDSGYGIHAYWPLSKSISATKWVAVARSLKAALAHCGVLADPTRTADFASILRPVGSLNRKYGTTKEVVVKALGTLSDPMDLATALGAFVKANGVVPKVDKQTRAIPNGLNDDLIAHLPQYPNLPIDANKMADGCAQVAAMRDSQGDVGYEHWRGVIGLLKHCVDGRTLAKTWSQRREETDHTQLDWDVRYDTWTAGPTTCAFFRSCNAGGCEGCHNDGSMKTPLIMGRVVPENEAAVLEVTTDDDDSVQIEVPPVHPGYIWSNDVLARHSKDKDGNNTTLPFCTTLFYATSRIRASDGTYRTGIRMHLPNNKVRDFDIGTEMLSSTSDMLKALGKYELVSSNHKDSGTHMTAYLKDQLEQLKRSVDEVNTMTTFGWRDDMSGFLVGDRLYHKDGTVRKVLVGGYAAKYKSALPDPKGSLARYAAAINFMYNRPGAEHWQYALCSGWGSLLTPFGEDLYRGLLMAISGGDSGKGKTTVCYASLYALGNADDMALKSEKGYTDNALWATMGAFNNMPILLDELTSMEPAKFSDAAYGVSRGSERARMSSRGGVVGFADSSHWAMSPFVTGNRDFHGLLASNQANSQAEAVRLIQIQVDRYPVVVIDKDPQREADYVQRAVDTMKANMGTAGDVMIRYIVANQKQVENDIRIMMSDLSSVLPAARYRFYRNHAACTLVAAKIAKECGVVEFDLDKLFEFSVGLLTDLAETVTTTNTITDEDAFNRLMGEISSKLLVTQEYRDNNHMAGPETPRRPPPTQIFGRMILGSRTAPIRAGFVYIDQHVARDWCMANRVDYNAMINSLEDRGALVNRNEKTTLTRGTDVGYSGQVKCFVVDCKKLDRDHLTVVSDNTDASDDSLYSVSV